MGQFQSKEYDGDPYVDLMRALPERELIWWVQKAIWLVEGYTFLDHFCRTYPTLFVHKCRYCNGAGSVTCPHCGGFKVKRQPALALPDLGGAASSPAGTRALVQSGGSSSSSSSSSPGAAPQPVTQECQHCGGYCEWDDESEWESKWMDWESKLAYYDRTYGELMNEWYEDVLHEGNLDEDTPHEEAAPPGSDEVGPVAAYDRAKRKYPQLLAALMARFGGHPYEASDMVQYNIVDPVKRTPLENLWGMGHNRNELPPELHPYNFPELLIQPMSPLTELDHQIRMEALICRNLDAALTNTRKPYMFEPTAGLVPCPSCYGTPYAFSLVPNLPAMFRTELPTFQRVLGRMSLYATQPGERAAAATQHFLEFPQQERAAGVLQQELEDQLASGPAPVKPSVAARRAIRKGARAGVVGGADRDDDPAYMEDWGTRGLAADSCGEDDHPAPSSSGTHRRPPGGPLVSSSPTSPWMPAASSSTAGPQLAAALLRDVRLLRQVQGTAAAQEVRQQLADRYSPAAIKAMLELGRSAASASRAGAGGAAAGAGSSRRPLAVLAEAAPGGSRRGG